MTQVKHPRIAILLDENTSGGGTRYEAAKGYFAAVARAGGLPFGIPYLPEMVPVLAEEFDGLLTTGGRFAYPDGWYRAGEHSWSPPSERLPVEIALVEAFLARDKPVLGICAGMQLLACLYGARMTADVVSGWPGAGPHDSPGLTHRVDLVDRSLLRTAIGAPSLNVNSFHREALVELPPDVVATAFAPDGVVEAIELPSRRFAVGLQWHQELLGSEHPGARVFRAFVDAARQPVNPPVDSAGPHP